MYRPFNDSWVQPIAAFATRNAAKGRAIQKVVMQAIVKLDSVGAEVLSIVCDGAKPNKSFWKLCGIGEMDGEIINKIPHPCHENRYLYFTCDIPHLFKCIRNHCFKYRKFKFFECDVDFELYEKLLQEDSRRQCGLRKCPKLTRSHVKPNCFEKMVVALATQLFSRSVATGLEFYRKLGHTDFLNSEGTQRFTQIMNDLFDVLNARFPKDGIRMCSLSFFMLKNFYSKLLTVDTTGSVGKTSGSVFASKETLVALKITLKSTIDMIEYLSDTLGFGYVLTAKMNQDCLKKFFGLIRAAGGREDHPTVSNFIQLFRLLSLYTPVRKVLRGNVRTDEDVRILVDLEKNFRQAAATKKERMLERKQLIGELIIDKLLDAEEESQIYASSYRKDEVSESIFDDNIIYHLSGFLCYRARNLIECCECVESLSVLKTQSRRDVSFLTVLLDYGGLYFASDQFFSIVRNWEKNICKVLRERLSCGDIILECLSSIPNFCINGVGCGKEGHGEEVIKILLPYYVTTRVHIFTRSIRRSLGKGKATKNKRKESKLLSK